jgi:hypothetical protein
LGVTIRAPRDASAIAQGRVDPSRERWHEDCSVSGQGETVMSIQTIESCDLVNVVGGNPPGQIDQAQAARAAMQGGAAAAPVGGAVGSSLAQAVAPPLLRAPAAAVGDAAGRVVGGTYGAVNGYVRNVGSQISGWFR